MFRYWIWAASGLSSAALLSCSAVPPHDPKIPGPEVAQALSDRTAAVLVTERIDTGNWGKRRFTISQTPGDSDGGSATPVAPDGYFLTADHVLAGLEGRRAFVLYRQGPRMAPYPARVVWRSASNDLALLHIDAETPRYFQWTDPAKWLPAETPVMHGGIATGRHSGWGRLGTHIPPEGTFSGATKFKIDIPLQPGDSGGPIVDAYGNLVGINSAVEFLVPLETAFFVDSEGSRPDTRSIASAIDSDRARKKSSRPTVE
jgi:S1-C subfamily serine protease